MNTKYLAHLALLFTNLFFAINLSAVKHLTGNQLAGPFGINVVRVGVSVILLWTLFFLRPVKLRIEKKDVGRLVLCAVTGIAVNQLFFLKGLSLTYSIHAALLMLITPILIVLISTWLFKEKFGIFKNTGLVLGVSGAAVLIVAKENVGEGNNILVGDILIIINAFSYTAYFILVKPLMLKYNPVVLIRWIFSIGLIIVLPFGWNEFKQIPWEIYKPVDLISMGLVTITGTFLAYLFNLYGIKMLGSSIAGFYIYTQPVFATIIAMLFLKEHLSLYKSIAALLIFSGVFLVNSQNKGKR